MSIQFKSVLLCLSTISVIAAKAYQPHTATLELEKTPQQNPNCPTDQHPFYIPFYINDPEAASIVASQTDNDGSIDVSQVGLDPNHGTNLNRAELALRYCFTCDEVMQFVTLEKQHIIQSKDYSSCQVDDDCATSWAETPLRGGCQSISNLAGKQVLSAWSEKWNTFLTESNQIEFYRSKCGYMSPMCMQIGAKCVDGSCQFAPIHHYETYTIQEEDVP